ncbi:hypothetical protein [Chryseobacterium glaciei]|nr:hypothetical protein [Chryseobacterium glaciei]
MNIINDISNIVFDIRKNTFANAKTAIAIMNIEVAKAYNTTAVANI